MIFNDAVWKIPKISMLPGMDVNGVKAIYYEGLPYKGLHVTKVFAYIGFPEGASETGKVPGVVCVHGGGGTAFAGWVKKWNQRGYAAISMDTEGCLPDSPGGEQPVRHPDAGPIRSNYEDIGLPTEDQWMYHAVADTFLAYNLLAADKRVDGGKIGVTGISWGGVITSIAIGNADVFAFAVPVYCGGYLHRSLASLGPVYKDPEVIKTWEASNWLGNVKTPTLWLGSDSDTAATVDTVSLSRRHTPCSALTILPGYIHSHEYGMEPPEIYAFADCVVKGGRGFGRITKQPENTDMTVCYELPENMRLTGATLYYLTADMEYEEDHITIKSRWQNKPLADSGGKIAVEPPEGARIYYVSLEVDGTYIISSDVYKLSKERGT